jgi:hypothetical protein
LLPQICEDLWNNDSSIWKKTREAFYEYVDEVMTATYSKPLSFIHNCRESTQGNVYCVDTSVGVPVSDLDCNTDGQTTADTVANGTCSTTNLRMPVADLTYNFIIEEPRANKYFTCVINPATHPKSDGQTCIQVDSAIILVSHPKSDGCPSNNVYLWFKEKDLHFFCDARHESLCYNDNGKLVRCQICHQDFSLIDLGDSTLSQNMHKYRTDCLQVKSSVSA